MPTVVVGAATVTLFPDVVVTVWLVEPLMLYVKVYGEEADPPVKVISGDAEF